MPTDDRTQIITITTRMAWLADRRDWIALTKLFTGHVDLDYTSLTEGEPASVAAAALVAGWQANLGGLDATQHILSNHLVEIDGAGAGATAQFQATHILANPFGEPRWTLGGHYQFTLVRADGDWRISGLTMTATWASGNQHIMTLAAKDS